MVERHFNRVRVMERRRGPSVRKKIQYDGSETEHFYLHVATWSSVFPHSDFFHAATVLKRLRRMRSFQACQVKQGVLRLPKGRPKGRKKYHDRNYHHLIPKSREGNSSRLNILLIKERRHAAWHRIFRIQNKEMTLDEIILLLERVISDQQPEQSQAA